MITQAIINPYWDEIKDRLDEVVDGLMAGMGIKRARYAYERYEDEDVQKTLQQLATTPYASIDIDIDKLKNSLYFHRKDFCNTYTWAIPDPATVTMVAWALGESAVEMGAGTGYWAYLLSQMGIDIMAYDEEPPDTSTKNHWHSPMNDSHSEFLNQTREIYFPVQPGTPEMLAQHPDRTLFLCWPPYGQDMAYECLKHYTGNRLVFIGEGEGGCTGDDDFFALLDKEWEEVEIHKPIQWDGMHDYVMVYERAEK